jgi:hypothetical protein
MTQPTSDQLHAQQDSHHDANNNSGNAIYHYAMMVWVSITAILFILGAMTPDSKKTDKDDKTRPLAVRLVRTLSLRTWNWIHAVSCMTFGGSIITSSLLEGWIVMSHRPDILTWWYSQVPPPLQAWCVGPSLVGLVASGIAMSTYRYGSLTKAPFHIRAGLMTFVGMTVWWAVTDWSIQDKAEYEVEEFYKQYKSKSAENSSELKVPTVLWIRQGSNVVSSLMVIAIYSFMALKPGK